MNPTQLSRELRNHKTPDLTRRRWIVGLNLLGVSMGQLVSAYQTGLIPRLPDPPGKLGEVFNATKVDASDYAYKRYRSPDGVAMVTTYAVTTWLAGAGGEDRANETPLLPIAMGAKLLYDVGTTLQLAREEWEENGAFCQYCQVATLASVVSAALAAPEVWRAVKALRDKSGQSS